MLGGTVKDGDGSEKASLFCHVVVILAKNARINSRSGVAVHNFCALPPSLMTGFRELRGGGGRSSSSSVSIISRSISSSSRTYHFYY